MDYLSTPECSSSTKQIELKVTDNRLYICTLSDLNPGNDLKYINIKNGSYYFKDMGYKKGYLWCKPGEEKTKGDDILIVNTRNYDDEYLRGTYHNGFTRNSDLIKIKDVLLKTKSYIRIVDEEDDKHEEDETEEDDKHEEEDETETEYDERGNEYIPDYNNYPLMFYLTERIYIEESFTMYFKNKTIINDKIIYKIVFDGRFVGYVVNTELINVYGGQAGIWFTLKNNDKKKLEVVNFGNHEPDEYDYGKAESNYFSTITSYTPDAKNDSDSDSDSDSNE